MSELLRNVLSVIVAAGLVACFWWQGERFLAANGPTFDEGVHLTAGYSYWMTGDFRLNREHPPLLKMLWAAPLAAGERPPYPHDVAAASNNNHWQIADALLYRSSLSHTQAINQARRVNLALGCCVVLLVGWWAFRAWGSRLAGLAACAFAAFDPTLLALSCVLSTDVGLALFGLLSAYLLWEYAAAPSRGLLLAVGVSLGLLLGSKFSAVALVGAFGVAGLMYVLRGGVLVLPGWKPNPLTRPVAALRDDLSPTGRGGADAVSITPSEEPTTPTSPRRGEVGERGAAEPTGEGVLAVPLRTRLRAAAELAFRLAVIALVTLAATYAFVHFDQWGAGLKFQLTRGDFGDGVAYLNGELSRTGWYHYFLIVLPLKLPLGLLIAAAVGGASILAGTSHGRLSTQYSVLSTPLSETDAAQPHVPGNHHGTGILAYRSRMWLLVPPLVFLAAVSFARVNLGVRVVLPFIPFLYVFAARLAVPGCCRIPRLVLLGGCVAWVAVAGWLAAPHQLAYFNEIAGGPTRGLRFAADSNLDWGQGLPALRQYMEREKIDAVYLAYFGTDRPEAYGIRYQPLPGYGRVGPAGGETIPADAPRHVVAVSANHLVGLMLDDPDTFAWLRGRQPTAVLNGCIYVFDLTGAPQAIAKVRGLIVVNRTRDRED